MIRCDYNLCPKNTNKTSGYGERPQKSLWIQNGECRAHWERQETDRADDLIAHEAQRMKGDWA